MTEKKHKTNGVFFSKSKTMSSEETEYYRMLVNNYGLCDKLVTILRAVKDLFFPDKPLEETTIDTLCSACEYYLNDPNYKAYLVRDNQLTIPISPVQYASMPAPATNPTADSTGTSSDITENTGEAEEEIMTEPEEIELSTDTPIDYASMDMSQVQTILNMKRS